MPDNIRFLSIDTGDSLMKKLHLCALPFIPFIAMATPIALAGDIARDIRDADSGYSQDGGHLEYGIGLLGVNGQEFAGSGTNNTKLSTSFSASYQWKGIFAEIFSDSGDIMVAGYNAYNSANWSLDFIVIPENNTIDEEVHSSFSSLTPRRGDTMGGLRATGYFGNNIVQLQLRHEIGHYHNGMSTSLVTGKSWQIRNQNYHLLVGLKHKSSDIVNYYYGVNESEASNLFSVYSAKAATSLTAEAGVTYPVTENWVMRSSIKYSRESDEIVDSPLMFEHDPDLFTYSVSMNYVFK